MSQSRTLYVGMDVHKESIAVAYVALHIVPRLSPSAPSGPGSVLSISLSGSCGRKPGTRLRLRSRSLRLLALSLPDETRRRLLGRRPP